MRSCSSISRKNPLFLSRRGFFLCVSLQFVLSCNLPSCVSSTVQTTSNNVQHLIESHTEKRTKGVFMPAGGKKMVCFLDDLNVPAHDLFGSQPPLELLRFWMDYGFWYDLQKQTRKFVKVRNDMLTKAGKSSVC